MIAERCITNFWRSITLNLFPDTGIYSQAVFSTVEGVSKKASGKGKGIV